MKKRMVLLLCLSLLLVGCKKPEVDANNQVITTNTVIPVVVVERDAYKVVHYLMESKRIIEATAYYNDSGEKIREFRRPTEYDKYVNKAELIPTTITVDLVVLEVNGFTYQKVEVKINDVEITRKPGETIQPTLEQVK